jgi:hypothetical protein
MLNFIKCQKNEKGNHNETLSYLVTLAVIQKFNAMCQLHHQMLILPLQVHGVPFSIQTMEAGRA